MQDKIEYIFTSLGLKTEQEVIVVDFKGHEGISQLYEYTINLKSISSDIDLNAMLSSRCTFTMKVDSHSRPIHGILSNFELLNQSGKYTLYRAVLVPRLWQLTLYHTNEVYLGLNVIDLIKAVLSEAGITSLDYDMDRLDDYKVWPYRCQWDESHFHLISRLMEREGIYYYFEQGTDAEKIIFCDSWNYHGKMADPSVNYTPISGFDIQAAINNVNSFICRQKRMPKKVILQDYNYEMPSLDVTGQATVDSSGIGDVFLYGENFETPEEGNRLARIRAEEMLCTKERYYGEGMVCRMVPGYLFDLENHFRQSVNREYLLTHIKHEGMIPSFISNSAEEETEARPVYYNSFTAIPSNYQFRPKRMTPKSKFYGMANAVVDGITSGEYAELDEHGRYKVRLPFDREGSHGPGNASFWFRKAEPYAGLNEGMHFPLRQHTEVLLTFIDGDPDRPIISGAVSNPATPNIVTGENHTKNVLQTQCGNKLEMDDQKGSKRLKMYCPEANSYMHLGAPNHAGRGIVMLTEGIHRMEIGGGYQRTLATETAYDEIKTECGGPIGQVVDSIRLTSRGSGYTTAPTITIGPGGGTNATAEAILGPVVSMSITNGGSGYTSEPTVEVTGGGGTDAGARVELSSDHDTAGTINTGGIGNSATSTVSNIILLNGGSGYKTVPTINITGGGGSGASAEAVLNDYLTEVKIINHGTSYTSVPTVTIDPPSGQNGTTSTAIAVLGIDPQSQSGGDTVTADTGIQDVFTRGMLETICTFNKRNPATGLCDKTSGRPVLLEPQVTTNVSEENSEIRGNYLIERKLGDYYQYRRGTDFLLHHPNNKTFEYGNAFRVIHKDKTGNTQSLINDLVKDSTNNPSPPYRPTGTKDFSSNSNKAWDTIINEAHVSLTEHDTITGQKGNIYDFGGYWNYNLGNCYIENHIDQQAKLNTSNSKDLLNSGGPGWTSISDNKISDKGSWDNGDVWVEKKFGNSYDFFQGNSIEVSAGSSQEVHYGGRHTETKYTGKGVKTYESVSEKGVSTEHKYDRNTSALMAYSTKSSTGGGLAEFSFAFCAKATSDLSFGFASSFSLNASGYININMDFGLGISINTGASAAIGVKGHYGGTNTFDVVTGQWDGGFVSFNAQKEAVVKAEIKNLLLDHVQANMSIQDLVVTSAKLAMKTGPLGIDTTSIFFKT